MRREEKRREESRKAEVFSLSEEGNT